MNYDLEMLSSREQLMEDIDCIVCEFFDETWNMDDNPQHCITRNEFIATICDAVCKNFPNTKLNR
ncbi:MAG: hypothetical protein VXX91_08275 [Planctomycetota bacterium]|nr:hypothetical protein [Planctomycetota bacterium]